MSWFKFGFGKKKKDKAEEAAPEPVEEQPGEDVVAEDAPVSEAEPGLAAIARTAGQRQSGFASRIFIGLLRKQRVIEGNLRFGVAGFRRESRAAGRRKKCREHRTDRKSNQNCPSQN